MQSRPARSRSSASDCACSRSAFPRCASDARTSCRWRRARWRSRSDEIERELGRPPKARGFTREALERLRDYGWPGNERELLERVRAALRLARGEEIDAEDLALGGASSDELPSFRDAKRAFERDYVARVLRLCAGNISRAARIAKKDRKDFYDVLRRNQINPDDYR